MVIKMRRAEREVTDPGELEAILKRCDVCRLGLCDGNAPYVVPLNFGYELSEGELTLYFHCAGEGKKLELIRRNPNACFETDCGHELVRGPRACDWTMRYESVIGEGTVSFVESPEEKEGALRKVMEQYAGRPDFSFDQNMLRHVTILKLSVSHFTGKRHL